MAKFDPRAAQARHFRKLLPILADMLAYERAQFEAEPSHFYVHTARTTRGPYDTREEAEARAALTPGATVSAEPGELNVDGGDLVDAFSEWREQLKQVLGGGGLMEAPCGKLGPAAIVVAPPAMVADTPEIESVLWLSTAHLTWDTVERIEACGQDGAWCCFPLNYGFLAYVYPADRKPDDIPGDLWRCLDYARRHGCAYIRFDADGPIMGALPDWSYTHR